MPWEINHMTDASSAEALMPLLQFDDSDLQANRNGSLGANQRQRLQRLQSRALLVGTGGFFAFALVSTAMLFFGQGIWIFLGIFSTMLNALFVGMVARQWLRLGTDLRHGEVEAISGELERVVKMNQRMNNFLIRVNGEEFTITKDLFLQFRHEKTYTLYRAVHSRVLLAAERR